jgi:hypothetical protein
MLAKMTTHRIGSVCVAMLVACEGRLEPNDSATWVTPFGPEARTGFEDCDAVIEAYKPCIDARAPISVRDDVRMGMERSIANWLDTAAQPNMERRAVRNGFVYHCEQALQRWTKTAAAFGCDPPASPPK